MSRLHLDGETASGADLWKVGLHAYMEHLTTRVWCVAHAFDNEPPRIWRPGMPVPPRINEHIRSGGEVWAHNAPFERWMVNLLLGVYGWPSLSIQQMRCTLAQSAAMAIPLDLARACAAVGITVGKWLEGQKIMEFLAELEPDGSYRTPEKYPEYHRILDIYCCQDLISERELGERTLELSPRELEYWMRIDQPCNDRGVLVDEVATRAALRLVKAEEARLDHAMETSTNGYVSSVNCHIALREWVGKNGGPDMPGVAKDDVETALAGTLADNVRKVLELRHEAAKSSTKKLVRMMEGRCSDGRMRGLFQFCGAGRTLRWSGRRAQVQNYPRQVEFSREWINWFLNAPHMMQESVCKLFGFEPMRLVSQLLRGMLIAEEGYRLIAVDLAQIEVRMAAWLAGDEPFLEEFRGRGKVYERDAAFIYGVSVDSITKGDERRQVGKVSGLAFQYGGGVNAFRNMGKIYKVPHFSDETITAFKDAWRAAHQPIVRYWSKLETAAMGAVRNPGEVQVASEFPRVAYVMNGSTLFVQRPSGAVACYPGARIESKRTPWGEVRPALTYRTIKEEGKGEGRDWVRTSTWGGKLFENLDQGASRDVFCDKLLESEDAEYPTVLHGHDEGVFKRKLGEGSLEELCAIFSRAPEWAPGLPLAADGWEDTRYRK